MIDSLYDNFKNWSKNGSVYLISDTHFKDKDTKIMNPDWIRAEEHINLLNNKIRKNDTLICLGDCGDLEYIRKLKAGYKILIKGNHDDKGNSYYKKNIIKKIYDFDTITRNKIIEDINKEYQNHKITINESYEFHSPFHRYNVYIDNNLFDEVYDGALFISDKILLSHEPIFGLKFCLNIHGHVHNGTYKYIDKFGCKHLNIASDVINYGCINLKDIIKTGELHDIDTIHRITIDNAISKKG